MARQTASDNGLAGASPEASGRLDPAGPVPLYHQIFLIIRDKIYAGEWRAGDLVPGEQELTEIFDVSRITAKRALNELADAGLVVRERGRGTRVIQRPAVPAVTSSIEGWLENMSVMGRSTEAEVLAFDYGPASEDVSAALDLAPGAEVQRAVRIRRLDGEPMSYLTTFVPAEIGRHYDRDALEATPLLQLLERAGVAVASARQTISASIADAVVANALDCPAGAALISVQRIVRDEKDRPVEYIRILYRPDLYRMDMAMRRITDEGDPHWATTEASGMTERMDG